MNFRSERGGADAEIRERPNRRRSRTNWNWTEWTQTWSRKRSLMLGIGVTQHRAASARLGLVWLTRREPDGKMRTKSLRRRREPTLWKLTLTVRYGGKELVSDLLIQHIHTLLRASFLFLRRTVSGYQTSRQVLTRNILYIITYKHNSINTLHIIHRRPSNALRCATQE